MKATDIKLEDDLDLFIDPRTGDFGVGYSDERHIQGILIAEPGNYREHPLCGVGIRHYLNAPFTLQTVAEVKKKIQLQLMVDGFAVNKIAVDGGFENVAIDAER